MKTRLVLTLLSLSLLVGCAKRTIDGSSDAALKSSMERVKAGLSAEEKAKFEESIMVIAFNGGNIFQMAADKEDPFRRMRDRLNGKTAAEVIIAADKVKAEQAKLAEELKHRERAQIESEIVELEAKKKAAIDAATKLKSFEVERSRFYFSEGRFSHDAVIELSVVNNTGIPVSRVFFHGVLATPGRSIPWVEDDFNYPISGGLEPGEKATWKLSPNMFGAWSRAPKDRTDMVLTVTVKRVNGPDEKTTIDGEFSKFDAERLADLQSKLKE